MSGQARRTVAPPRHTAAARMRSTNGPPLALQIPELVILILSHLPTGRDLLNMALTSRHYTDAALRLLWESPDFPGNPLESMLVLFPDSIRPRLVPGPDTVSRIPVQAFARFDYYAKFIRHLQVWNFVPDAHIGRILSDSRPNTPLFPSLESIHLGADDNTLQMTGVYLSPSLRLVRINHWDGGDPTVLEPSPGVTAALLMILNLPLLDSLDFLDTRFPAYEHDPGVLNALLRVAPRLIQLYSCDFTTLRPIFDILATSDKLQSLFLLAMEHREGHYTFEEVITRLRQAFRHLQTLVMQSPPAMGIQLLQEAAKPLQTLEYRVEGAVDTDVLSQLIGTLQPSRRSLRVFRCSSSELATEEVDTNLETALVPLQHMRQLRRIILTISLHGTDMLNDLAMQRLFPSWPHLSVFVLETDPEQQTPMDVDSPNGYGLTLWSLITVRQSCPNMTELSLPYVDTTVIPSLTNIHVSVSHMPIDIRLSRCHAHNRAGIRGFIRSIWLEAECSFEDCICPQVQR